MRNYEVAFIVHPDQDENAFKETTERVQGWVEKAGGKVTKVDLWGKKKLAYEINKQTEGQYVLFQTEMPPSACSELEREFQFAEPIIRFMITSATSAE